MLSLAFYSSLSFTSGMGTALLYNLTSYHKYILFCVSVICVLNKESIDRTKILMHMAMSHMAAVGNLSTQSRS